MQIRGLLHVCCGIVRGSLWFKDMHYFFSLLKTGLSTAYIGAKWCILNQVIAFAYSLLFFFFF